MTQGDYDCFSPTTASLFFNSTCESTREGWWGGGGQEGEQSESNKDSVQSCVSPVTK